MCREQDDYIFDYEKGCLVKKEEIICNTEIRKIIIDDKNINKKGDITCAL